MNPHRLSGLGLLLALAMGAALPAHAQTFRMPCEVSGTIPAQDDRKLPPEKVVVEIQSMGRNIFLKIGNSKNYQAVVSSLTADDFLGKNLTTEKQMGAYRKHKATGHETELRINREPIVLYGYNDIVDHGRTVRVQFEGPCTLPQ